MTLLAHVLVLACLQSAEEIPVREYVARLEEIRSALRSGDLETVRERAGKLRNVSIRFGRETILPDTTILGPLEKVTDKDEGTAMADRLDRLIGSLSEADGEPEGTANVDPDLLERLRKEEEWEGVRPGGDVGGLPVEPRIPRSVLERIMDALQWLGEKALDILNWLLRLVFGAPSGESGFSITRILTVILIVVIAVVLVILALWFFRWRRRGEAETTVSSSAPAMSRRDEDPLSRTASEWEKYAEQLAAAGRHRESVRAWYHALLVTMYRSGLLHYRKDRTNWEYAYALSPELSWRPGFMDATRDFEREWYGRRDSSGETSQSFAQGARKILRHVREGWKS